MTEITKAIAKWNEIGSTEQIAILKQGNNFSISRAQYKSLEGNEGDFVHVYLGVNDLNNLEFYLINSTLDAKGDYSNIITCDFNYGLDENEQIPVFTQKDITDDNITLLQGLERMFRFQMEFPNWIKSRNPEDKNLQPMFRAFNLNFDDLNFLFADPNCKNVMACYGMRSSVNKNDSPAMNTPELIIWNKDFTSANLLADVVLPVPPFGKDFNLLK